jgi:alpha-1,3-rhamnosyl/mannosyltransferase
LVALEAMAAGLPVVGYDLPSSREAFGNAMLQVESYDVDAFAAAVLRLLEDETSRNVYRQRGYRIAERYNWDKIAKVFAQDVIASAQGQTFASRSIS